MNTPSRLFHLHLVSDSTGETVSSVARAATAQFESVEVEEHTWSLVRTRSHMEKVLTAIRAEPGPVLYTVVEPGLRDMLKALCDELRLPCIAVLGGVVGELSKFFGVESHAQPGRQHELTEEYFTRVEAINFTLAHDDGQAHWELEDADVVLVGPSRTSKSPTCVYLAYKGLKAANVPYVIDIPLPAGLEELKRPLVVGLTISPDRLQQIRRTRLQSLKQDDDTNYVDSEQIQREIDASRRLFHRLRWPVIDVSRRSVEETAATIMQYYQKHQDKRAEAS